jgi:fatty acid desaturase
LCEHCSPYRDWVVRTIDGHRWQTWLMGAFDFNFHGEHHLFPSVPYAQLQRLRDLHRSYLGSHPEYRPFDGRFEVFDGGYAALLAHWFRVLPWRAA